VIIFIFISENQAKSQELCFWLFLCLFRQNRASLKLYQDESDFQDEPD
jgi:hypothetical protein